MALVGIFWLESQKPEPVVLVPTLTGEAEYYPNPWWVRSIEPGLPAFRLPG